jgi:hypothetical protein
MKTLKYFYLLSRFTRGCVIATLVFLFYGFLSRAVPVYFFWESETIGWALFWISAMLIFGEAIWGQQFNKKNLTTKKVAFGFSIFVIVLQVIMLVAIPMTGAYDVAIDFIKHDPDIRREVGDVKGVFLMPSGRISSNGGQGEANLNFIVKGSRKYIGLNLGLTKELETGWKVDVDE